MRNNDFPIYYPNRPMAFNLPLPGDLASAQRGLHDWANLFQASRTGAPYIEAYRTCENSTADPSSTKYLQITWDLGNKTTPTNGGLDVGTVAVKSNGMPDFGVASNYVYITWKYPGIPPINFSTGDRFKITLKWEMDLIWLMTISTNTADDVEANITTTNTKIEEYYVSPDPKATLDGASVFIENVLTSKSAYFRAKSNYEGTNDPDTTSSLSLEITKSNLTSFSLLSNLGFADYKDARAQFKRFEVSRSTIILGASDEGDKVVTTWSSDVAMARNDVHIFYGYPKEKIVSKDFDLETTSSIQGGNLPGLTATGKFASTYVCCELFDAWTGRMYLNGIGSIAGATAGTALAVNRNQPASAQTYGSFPGVLYSGPRFDTVLELHEQGIGSVYAAVTGPQIFNVRTLFSRQTSYFGKLNCMRVIEAILRRVINAAISVIHTPAAANPTERAIFGSTLTSILTDFMPNEILPDSYADVGDAINNDTATHGGEILYINLNLHLIKVVERVKIAVIATDSSVTVQY
jgi:hypothetical protein